MCMCIKTTSVTDKESLPDELLYYSSNTRMGPAQLTRYEKKGSTHSPYPKRRKHSPPRSRTWSLDSFDDMRSIVGRAPHLMQTRRLSFI